MIYFDNSATTKPYKEVIDSFVKVSTDYFGNPSSLHGIGGQAEKLLSQARHQVAQLLKVRAGEVYFTSGGTESNNLAIKGTALMYRNRGRHIITTSVEHASVKETMNQLSDLGFRITYLPVDQSGRISLLDLENAICHDTILVSIIHVNNEIGTIQPIEEIGKLLKEYPKILFHVDHVQGIGKVPLDFFQCRLDFCSISGHKFHGVKGTGVLYIREGVTISPLFSGGNQEWKQRSGTENVAGMVALAKALRMTMEQSENKLSDMATIKNFLIKELNSIEQIVLNTPEEHSAPHIINFSIRGVRGEVFVHALEEFGVYVSTTSACSSKKQAVSHTLLAMNVPKDLAEGSIRISLSFENTLEEATKVVNALKMAVQKLSEVLK
ncbi:cysteine desulfurase family protein [Bacillus sp. 31A1R]|uniref:Cysteine desulfurase family protein n=1 Tax=Robertmurraya mangrovi TaxID=3098077 RepID=A0ABU5IZD3_9BACI|nr:cysteine desulfurase family protein [Bacillus sp. 31A1R]MDZ5472528.1 cysteine desulfurase family protein [Bacillus sp. 31A1R]